MSNFTLENVHPVSRSDRGFKVGNVTEPTPTVHQVAVLRCQGCGQCTVVIEERYVGGQRVRDLDRGTGLEQWRGFYWWPTPGTEATCPDVPLRVGSAVAEGVVCLSVRAPRAAAVMFRGALAEIVADRASDAAKKKRNLAEQLKHMAADGDLDRTIAEWATHIRQLGNVAAHPNELEEVTQEEAEDLSRLMTSILDYLYVMPATIQRRRSVSNQRP